MNLARQLLTAWEDAQGDSFHLVVETTWFLIGLTILVWLLTL